MFIVLTVILLIAENWRVSDLFQFKRRITLNPSQCHSAFQIAEGKNIGLAKEDQLY
jgi:hypothetical protein